MFIIDCLPFSKGLNKESLSYFSTNPVEPELEGSALAQTAF
jgi:hypothetical protein